MVEISLSGSGEGPGWETSRPTLQATFHAVPPARVRPPPATLRPLVPTPGGGPPAPHCPPGAGLARACPEAPTPAAGQPCREPAGHRPAPPGTARTAAGPPARLGRRGNGLFHRWRPPTLSPPRHRPRSPPAHQRSGAAAWRSQRWPPDGGGWPCAAWVMGSSFSWRTRVVSPASRCCCSWTRTTAPSSRLAPPCSFPPCRSRLAATSHPQ
jgi:hypothetical protein